MEDDDYDLGLIQVISDCFGGSDAEGGKQGPKGWVWSGRG
jgi:hypothetical protein